MREIVIWSFVIEVIVPAKNCGRGGVVAGGAVSVAGAVSVGDAVVVSGFVLVLVGGFCAVQIRTPMTTASKRRGGFLLVNFYLCNLGSHVFGISR